MEGNWRPELLFVLRQELESYQTFQTKIAECDQQLHRHYKSMEAKADPKRLSPDPARQTCAWKHPRGIRSARGVVPRDRGGFDGDRRNQRVNHPNPDSRVGYDMSRFATEAHFVSFLDLSPRNKISGGKVVGREKRKTKNRAGLALRLAAGTLLESDNYLGAQYRRLRTKLGVPKARKAMANKLARIAYRMLKYGEKYVEKGKELYEQKYRQLQTRMLTKKATELGLQLVQPA